jgi:hypothetical protein
MKREWQCVLHTVTLVLPPFHDVEWEAPVRFAVDEGLPFGLLGFEGFLNRWAVSFDGANGYTVVETVESFDQRVPPDLWEEPVSVHDGQAVLVTEHLAGRARRRSPVRSEGPDDPRTLGPSDPRTLRPSDPQTLRPSDPQTLRPSDPQTLAMLAKRV